MHPFVGLALYAALALVGVLLPRDSNGEVIAVMVWAGFTFVVVPFYVFALAPKLRKTLYLRVNAKRNDWRYERAPWKWAYSFGRRPSGVETRMSGTFCGHNFDFTEYAEYSTNHNREGVRCQTNRLTIPLPVDKNTHEFSAKFHWWGRIKKSEVDAVRLDVDDDFADWLASQWGFNIQATAGCIGTIEQRGINPMRIRRQLRFLIKVINRLPTNIVSTRTSGYPVRQDEPGTVDIQARES